MKKIFMIALCLGIVPMLFAGTSDADVVNETVGPTLKGPRSLLVDRMPIEFVYDRSDLLFDQQATAYNTFCACQNDSAMAFYPRIADNFSLTANADIDSLVWWGGYWGTMTNSITDFYIEIYPDSAGFNQPQQDPIYSARVGFVETLISAPQNYYYYEAVIPPFAATAGVTYWIVFQPFLTYPPQWGNNCDEPPAWGDGQEMYFKSPYFGYPQWVTATTVFGFVYESAFQIYGNLTQSFPWDFEDGLQGWTHTNGQAFPAGWDVEVDDVHASYACPDPGDSSMWIDSDAGGNGFWIQDTALSPAVVPPSGMTMLVYGVGFNGGSGSWIDDLYVGINHFTSGVWTAVELQHYVNGTAYVGWDTLDVTAYNTADSIRVWFYFDDLDTWGYYASFDNVGLYAPPDHDVGCIAVTSPPAGTVPAADYDVIGRIHNYGGVSETFDVTATVWDTTGMVIVFGPQTFTLTDFPSAGDSLVNFGTVTFAPDSWYYTEIFTLLGGDSNPSNDTSSVSSTTAMSLGDVIFEMDAGTLTGDTHLLGIEFDGTYFYVTGGNSGADPNKVYVIDTAGILIWTMDQPSHSTGWGWRDITWDNVNLGTTIDTLYASVNTNVDKFSIDLTSGILTSHGPFSGPSNPNRALAYKGDSLWFFTASFGSPCYKFTKTSNLQNVGNTWLMYGAAYDTDTVDGDWVWWHSQDDPGTGFQCQIEQMEPISMGFTGLDFGYVPTILTSGVAGGMCFYEGFRGMDVLFCLVQGAPQDAIVGVFVRTHDTGVEEQTKISNRLSFGISAHMANPTKNLNKVTYTTTKAGQVSLKVYNNTGRLVQTLVNTVQPAGVKTVSWDASNNANGVYFLKLDAQGETATHKMILMK